MKRACDQTNADPNSNERVSDKAEKKKKGNQLAGQSIDESGKLKCQSSSKQEDQPEYLKQKIRTLEEELDITKEDGMRNKKVVQLLQKFISDLRQEDEMSDVRYEAPTNIEKTYGDDILDEISSRIKDLKQRVLKGKPFKKKEKFEKQIKMSEERQRIKSNDWKTEKAALENKLKDSNESIILLNEKNENLNRDLKETQRVNVELQHQMQIEKDKYQNQYRELQHKETCIDNLERELQKTKNEKEELILRLSKLAAARLTSNNPNIADLSDTNRPNKIAERYSELYDNEWTDAFEEYRVKQHMEELQCIQALVDLLKATYNACEQLTKPNRDILKTLTSVCITLHSDLTHTKQSAGIQDHSFGRSTSPDTALKMDENKKDNGRYIAEESSEQGQEEMECEEIKDRVTTIPKGFTTNVDTGKVSTKVVIDVKFSVEEMKTISDMRRLSAVQFETEKNISKLIAEKIAFEQGIDTKSLVKVMAFITECAKLCWYMAIQEPPVVIEFHKPVDNKLHVFDHAKYKAYTKTGDKMDYVVWPPLLLYSGGGILCRGIAQGKK